MRVLSLFDGISCAYEALLRAKVPITSYHAAEIDPYAIEVSTKRHPDIVRLGCVKTVKKTDCDLLIGGSPCQDLSIAKNAREGLAGERSGLFFEYVRVLRESKPRWFILENVASMPVSAKDHITSILEVEPIMINASLVSAQSRKRLFWTNIPVKGLPEDKGILLKHILEATVDPRYNITLPWTATKASTTQGIIKEGILSDKAYTQGAKVYSSEGKTTTISAKGGGVGARTGIYRVGNINDNPSQANRIYSTEGKTPTLSANGGGLGAKTGVYHVGRLCSRKLVDGVRKDNETVARTVVLESRKDEKCGTITSAQKDNVVIGEDKTIRRLTPVECERLQGLPDNYTAGVSETQRYKCLGNGFNVDVIAFILSHILPGASVSP